MTLAAWPRPSKSVTIGVASGLLAALIWGAWFPLSRLAVTTSLEPADIVALRFGIAGLVLLPVALRLGLKAGKAGWTGTLVMTAMIGAPYPLLLAFGLQSAPAAHAAVFVPGVAPIITFLLAILILREPATQRRCLGVTVAACGVLLVAWDALLAHSAGSGYSYLLFLICATMWATYTVVARRANISAVHATVIITVASFLLYLPLYLLFAGTRILQTPLEDLLYQAVYQAVIVGIGAIFLYNFAVRALGASFAAVLVGMVPCFAAVLAIPILGEAIAVWEIAGIVAVSAGIVLVSDVPIPQIRLRNRAT